MHKVTFEPTPNPECYRFSLPDTGLEQPQILKDPMAAQASPLAKKIFGFPWAAEMMLGSNFITVTKQNWVEWDMLAQPLAGLIQEHLQNQEPLWISPAEQPQTEDDVLPTDSDLVQKIKRALAREIRPVVALDGGDVRFAQFENGVLYVSMRGACSGCPSSQATLKQGIEVRLKELFPEIETVESLP